MSSHGKKNLGVAGRLNLALGVIGMVLIIGMVAAILDFGRDSTPPGIKVAASANTTSATPVGEEEMGGSFSLVNQDGKAVTDKDYHGKYVLMTFGFTYCPDVCPTKLQDMSLAVDGLGDDAKWVHILFISIDPQRDTPSQMKNYVSLYPNHIQGLTGTAAQVADIAKKYKVYYKRAENTGDGEYMMDHSSQIYLLDPEGKFLDVYPNGTDPSLITQAIHAHLRP